ncbi:MAG: T9SS type A sorting domain-containing protein [Bacteroidetes bacterium]|nr:T9SS type A sorting domain-containing protein [Bacteroidota bacterium]
MRTKACGNCIPTGIYDDSILPGIIAQHTAINFRPINLSFWADYIPTATGDVVDSAQAVSYLSRWNTLTNSRDTIAYFDMPISAHLIIGWRYVKGDYNYLSSLVPDSLFVEFRSSSKKYGGATSSGTYLNLDNIQLSSLQLSVEKNTNNKFLIYPTLASDEFKVISNLFATGTARVYNYSGVLVKKQLITSSETTINIQDLLPGIYIVEVPIEGAKEVRKIVKQ